MAYKVLIVDDSKLARMALSKLLKAVCPDWERAEAANAAEALDYARKADVDIALLDFNMPGRDGLHLAADLRALNPGLQLAVVSANHQKEVVDRASAIGAGFLAKPLTEDALRGFLRHLEGKLEGR